MAVPVAEFDRPKLERLKQRYEEAVTNGEETFEFEGHELYHAYAKYMIEYLEGVLA